MSQAVAAPSTGDRYVTSGNVGEVSPSRRGLLAGMLLAPVAAAVPATAVAAQWEDPVLVSRRVDAIFWAARQQWLDIHEDWIADCANYQDRDMPDAIMDRWGMMHDAAEYAMLTARITTLPALYAKMEAIKERPDEFLRNEKDGTTVFEAVMWDVERLMMKAHLA
jgi:hypothetical protein